MTEIDLTLDLEPVEIPKVRFLRVYCSSPICSDGFKLKAKGDVWLNKPRNSSRFGHKPIDCPDCASVLFWKRITHGSLSDPIIN